VLIIEKQSNANDKKSNEKDGPRKRKEHQTVNEKRLLNFKKKAE
jgi:hypothetical protein